MWKCMLCGDEVDDAFDICGNCQAVKPEKHKARTVARESMPERVAPAQVSSSVTPGALVKRYVDLYRAARLLIGVGKTVKVIGIVSAIIILLFWFIVGILASSQGQPSSPFGPSPTTQSALQTGSLIVSIVIGAIFGALVGGLFFLFGVLISAQGQLLMAHADSAVHTSPFLTNEERATAMSLPYSAPSNKSLDASGGSVFRN